MNFYNHATYQFYSFLQLRAGLDPRHICEPVDTIVVPFRQGIGYTSDLVASKCGLMAVLDENEWKVLIYNHKRRDVLEFPLNSPVAWFARQIALDIHNNIIIGPGGRGTLLRFNMNGKALPHLEVPVAISTGIACSPEGDMFVSSNCPCAIVKKAVGQSEWVTIYQSQKGGYDEDEDDEY